MKLSFRCQDHHTIVLDLTLRQIQSDYLDAILETDDPSQILEIHSFDSSVVRSILGYIVNGHLVFDPRRTVSPDYLRTLYRACDYFLLGEYPELVDVALLGLHQHAVLTRATIYGRIGPNQLNTIHFFDCSLSNLDLDSPVTHTTFDECFFRHCTLIRTSFDEASDFRNCVFTDCDLTEAILPSLRGCCFQDCILNQSAVDFGAVVEDTRFASCSMRLFQACIPGMIYSRNVFQNCDLSGAVLSGFEHCLEERCVLSHAVVDNRLSHPPARFLPTTRCQSLTVLEASLAALAEVSGDSESGHARFALSVY